MLPPAYDHKKKLTTRSPTSPFANFKRGLEKRVEERERFRNSEDKEEGEEKEEEEKEKHSIRRL